MVKKGSVENLDPLDSFFSVHARRNELYTNTESIHFLQQVWAKRNSLPSDRPEERAMDMTYGYSYALGWLGVISTTASFAVNLVASGKQ